MTKSDSLVRQAKGCCLADTNLILGSHIGAITMKVSEAFGGKFLKAADVPEPLLLTITVVRQETMPSDEHERKWTLYFLEREQGLVLNATNARTLAELFGDDSESWVGERIVVFPTTTDFGGRQVDCLRVRKPKDVVTKAVDF